MSDDLVKRALDELADIVRCRCREAYTGRGLRDPECQCDSVDAVKTVADRIEELEAENKRFNEQMDAIEEMGTESLNALPDCLMRLAPALVENGDLKAKLERAECLLVDAMVQLGNGKIKLRRECAYLIGKFLAELKGQDDE